MSTSVSTSPASGSDIGAINIFYTGLPPYHPLVRAEGWDSVKIDHGVRDDAIKLVQAGFNVYVAAAGPETPMETIAEKMRSKGVQWHFVGIGMGVRTSHNPIVVHYLEDLLHLFRKEAPEARQVFNTGPGSCLESVKYRLDKADMDSLRQGHLLGYEELFDGQKGQPLEFVPSSDQ